MPREVISIIQVRFVFSMPNEEQALQFAIILSAGLPPSEAIRYFAISEDPAEIMQQLRKWMSSKAVRQAQNKLLGKQWQDLPLEERIKLSLDRHYSGMAWILFSQHYAEADSSMKGKLDAARQALEAKMAGTSGKMDALSQFFDDINRGRVKLAKPFQGETLVKQ
jgi:hypothetical protein